MKALPELAGLQFVETASTGTVHITYTVPNWAFPDPKPEEISGNGRSWAEVALATDNALTVMCGQRTYPHLPLTEYRHKFVSAFDDEKLCRACYRCLPEDAQELAFRHPQPSHPDPLLGDDE